MHPGGWHRDCISSCRHPRMTDEHARERCRVRKLAPIERGRVEGVRSIALVRANALGDFIFLLPALEALRRAYPGARISLLAKTWHARFLEGRECGLDEVVIIPDMPGFGGDVIQAADADIRDFFAQM